MDYTEWMLWKAGLVVLAAFCWGVFCGVTGRPLGRVPPDSRTEAGQD